MAIDTAIKRRAAAGVSAQVLPVPTGTIDADERAITMRSYLLSAITVVVTTPLARVFAVARELRVKVVGH